MIKNRVLLASIIVVICVILGAGVGYYTSNLLPGEKSTNPGIPGLLWPAPKVILPFAAVDQKGKLFTHEQLDGKWSFLFFGYTHCPDICPVTMSILRQVYENLVKSNNAENVQVIFISVDPERDTPETLAEYTAYFHKDFIGLTGSREQIEQLARIIGIAYVHGEKNASGGYLVDHTASIFLISPVREWTGIFSAPHDAEDITRGFRAIESFVGKNTP